MLNAPHDISMSNNVIRVRDISNAASNAHTVLKNYHSTRSKPDHNKAQIGTYHFHQKAMSQTRFDSVNFPQQTQIKSHCVQIGI